jgi:CysZ protein
MPMMPATPVSVLPAAFAAARQVFSPPLRQLLWRSIGFTLLLLGLAWWALVKGLGAWMAGHPLAADYPMLDSTLVFLAGAGLVVGFAYILPAVSALVAGAFLDDAALAVETSDFPSDPPGRPISLGLSIAYGLRFAALALAVNLVALLLIFVPVVNIVAFFGANAYLLSREYFEMAAGRFRTIEEARRLRRDNRATILAGGAVMAGLMMVPIANLLTPLFGIALMVHLHKRIARRLPPPL